MFDKIIFIKNNKKAEAFRPTSVFSANIQVLVRLVEFKSEISS